MAKKNSSSMNVDEAGYLVRALVMIVAKMRRNMNTKAEPPEPFRGVLGMAVEAVFYQIMAVRGHELAAVENADCSDVDPCNSCRKDVFRGAVAEAVKQGGVFVGHRAKWDVYFTPQEAGIKHYEENTKVAEEVLGAL
jgi:hypothetical protein